MLDAKAVIRLGHCLERGLERVEHVAVAAIADSVDVDLEAGAQRRSPPMPRGAAGVETSSPELVGSSLYGASSAAPREPSAPSA